MSGPFQDDRTRVLLSFAQQALSDRGSAELERDAVSLAARVLGVSFAGLFSPLPTGAFSLGVCTPTFSGGGSSPVFEPASGPGRLVGRAALSVEALYLENAAEDPRTSDPSTDWAGLPPGAWLAAPLPGWEQPARVLAVCDPSPKSFSRFDVSFLNELAALLSRALDRFQRERNLKTALAGMKQRLEWSSSSLEAARRQIDAEAAQRERVEVSLATEERYRFIFDHSADLIFLHWHAHDQFLGEPLDVNQTACQCLGYSRDELLMADTPLFPDSARTTTADARAALLETGRARFDIDLLSKDGQPLRFEFHCVLFELDGQPTVLSVARPAAGTERSPEAEPPEPAWLFDEVLERVAGDRSLLADMVQLFSHDLDNRLARMGRSLDDRDVTGLKEQAHGLKGAAGNLSVPGLVAVCSELENVVDAENWSEAPGLQTRLMKEAEAFKREARSKGFLDPSGDVRAGGGSDQITYSSSGSSTS